MKFTECLFSNRIRKAALALAFSGASLFAVGQPMDMSGTYTVNGTSNYAGRQFATFEEATDSLESRGVSGAVIIEAVNGTYDEHFIVGPIPGSSDANRITLRSQSGDSTDVVLTYTGYSTEEENYIIHLQGVSFLTIRGMTFDATPNQASGYGTAIRLRGDVDSTIIENCVFFGKDGSGGSAYKTLVSAHYLNYSLRSLTNDYNIVRNNLFTKGESAVGFYAYSGSYPHVGNIVENNICEDQTYLAIWSHSGLALTITGNTITNSNPDFNPSGVFIDNVDGANRVTNNKITLLNPTRGIYMVNCEASGATESTKGLVANNFVSMTSGNNSNYGIQLNGVDYYRVYHNSVNINSTISKPSSCAFRLEGSGSEGVDIRNNIFANYADGYAYYNRYTGSVETSDYNDYFTTGNYLALWDNEIIPTLSYLKSRNSKDDNSITVNPIFFSEMDLHTTLFHLESKGVNDADIKTAVPYDIDGEAWDGVPDIGADEFDGEGTAMSGIYTIGGTDPVFSTITEAVDSLNTVGISDDVYFHIRDGSPYVEQFVILPVSGAGPDDRVCFMPDPGNSGNVTITFDATSEKNYTVKMVRASYIDFRDLTINADNTTYSTVIHMVGMSSNDSIVNCTLTSTGTADNNACIYSTGSLIDGLHVHNSNITDGRYGIYVDGPNDDDFNPENITITNNDISGHYSVGVYLRECNAPLVENNTVSNGTETYYYWGIYFHYCINDFRAIKNRVLLDVDEGGILANYSDGTASFRGKIINNVIVASGSGGNRVYGIETSNSAFVDVYSNTVHIAKDNTSTSSRAYYNYGGSELKVKNNNFVNFGPGYAYYNSSNTAIEESDYNNLFSAGLYLAYWGSNQNIARLSDLLDVNGGLDNHSYNMVAAFLNETDPDINSPFLDTAGLDLSADPDSPVGDDFYGTPRGSTPSIGAFQYTSSVTPVPGGTYAVGPGETTPNYESILAALTDLQARGISGPIVLAVKSGNHNEFIGKVFKIPGSSASNTVTLTSATGIPGDATIFFETNNDDKRDMFNFVGVDNLIIRDLEFTVTGSSYGRPLYFSGTYENITIENNLISSGNTNHATLWLEGTSNDITIKDNVITKGSWGIWMEGNSNSELYSRNTIISGNHVSGSYYGGIYLEYSFEPMVIANIVENELYGSFEGMNIRNCREEMQITGNRIFSQYDNLGMYIYNCDATVPTFHGLVSNNIIHIGGSYSAYGIQLSACTGTRVYNNSIYLTSTYSYKNYTLGIYTQSNNLDLEIINNSVHNAGNGYAYYVEDDQDIYASDNNNFYSNTTDAFAWWDGTAYNTLADLKFASGKDVSSVELDPRYVSTTDLRSGQPGMYQAAIQVEGVDFDIDSVPRDPSTPDIGAVKFTCVEPVFEILVSRSCQGDSTVFIDISDSIAPGSTVGYNFPGEAGTIWAAGAGDTLRYLFTTDGTKSVEYVVYQIAGCGDNHTFNVEVLPSPELVISTQGVHCTELGSATVSVTGDGQYSYSWSTGSTEATATELDIGTYTVAVTDTSGCTTTREVPIDEAIQVTVEQLNPSTCGAEDGSAVVSASGGVPPYSYVWSNGETISTNSTLSAGFHYVNVIDSENCYAQGSINIKNDGSGPQIAHDATMNNNCYGERMGSINISVSGGNPPYSISWSNGETVEDIDSLAAGIYSVVVEDADRCLGAASFEVTEPAAMIVTSEVDDATCSGYNGKAVAVVNGGTAPFIYRWSTGGIYQIEQGLAAGIYSVTVTDAKGCEMVQPVLVNSDGGPKVTFTDVQGTGCSTPNSGSISTSVTGGVPSYNYLWYPDGQTTPDISGLMAKYYQVRVTDFNNCVGVNAVRIRQEPPERPDICMVTVDTNTHTNMVVWEKNGSDDVAYYNIYRESPTKGDFQLIGTRHADSLSVFTDPVADPFNRSWRYQLSAVDACGYESELSEPHKTIHLTMNLGLNDAVNLIWDHYEGFDFPTYDIYKYLPATGWTYLTGIASSQSTTYTDQPVPEEKVQYFIEIEAPEDGCEATDLKAATLNSSRSNRKGKLKISTGTGYVVDPGLLNIYPNPSDGIFTISMELERMDNVELNVFDITGKIIIRKQFDNVPFRLDSQIDLTGYEDGIYQVHLKTGNILLQRILIKD